MIKQAGKVRGGLKEKSLHLNKSLAQRYSGSQSSEMHKLLLSFLAFQCSGLFFNGQSVLAAVITFKYCTSVGWGRGGCK